MAEILPEGKDGVTERGRETDRGRKREREKEKWSYERAAPQHRRVSTFTNFNDIAK